MPTLPTLRELPLFDGLPHDFVAHLDALMTTRRAAPWTLLLRQHDMVRELLVLRSGTASTLVSFSGGGGELLVETTSTPGRLFGWSALRAPYRATASVRADTACTYSALPVDPVRERLSQRPSDAAAFYGRIAGALAERSRGIRRRQHEEHRDA